MISCLAIHTTDRSEKHKRKLCHKSSVIGVPNLLVVVVSQNKEGGGGSSSSSVQILIDNETGHKKEIEERKKASKSATILYILRRKVTNGILRTKELGGTLNKIE